MRLFIYEHISAGGVPNAPASLFREGAAMLAAISADFERVGGLKLASTLAQADAALIIAPEFDDLLASHSQRALDAGCRLLGCSLDSIRLTSDKLKLAAWLDEHDVSTIPTGTLEAFAPKAGAACVVKPRFGAGSLATFAIADAARWTVTMAAAHAEWPCGDFIVQPLQHGQPVSVACLVGPRQTLGTPGATQRLSNDGRFHYLGGSTPLPMYLRERAVALALRAMRAVPGLRGYVGVDVILGDAADGSGDAVVEINPRLTTSYIGLRQLTLTNLADVWLRLLEGATVPELEWQLDNVIDFSPDGRTSLLHGKVKS